MSIIANTPEEFLDSSPPYESLRTRAKAARDAAVAHREMEEQELIDDLRNQLWAFFVEELETPIGELAAAKETVGYHGGQPSATTAPMKLRPRTVTLEVDGVTIRCRYCSLHDFEPGDTVLFEYRSRSHAWHTVTSLAHLGQIMGSQG